MIHFNRTPMASFDQPKPSHSAFIYNVAGFT
uniref:Uncharacterized protein n=1 Tax=Anguilla anguilla TaxID=7936 RepID=A0A0E9PV00_ANGAN